MEKEWARPLRAQEVEYTSTQHPSNRGREILDTVLGKPQKVFSVACPLRGGGRGRVKAGPLRKKELILKLEKKAKKCGH